MNTNRLFNKLVDMTAIRDIELLEFSLLRTLHQYLNQIDLRIFRIDSENKVRSEIVYTNEKCRVLNKDHALSGDLKKMVLHIKRSELNEYTQKLNSDYLTLYKIHATPSTTLFLQVLNHDRISRENRHLLIGLLQIFRNYIELLGENITDSLTGLLNRKSFDRTIDKIYDLIPDDDHYEGNKRNTNNANYWLAMIDIDHFKMVNDKFGHLYGDDVLILLAQIIKNCFRDNDLFFRFGGEEFVLIIRCNDIEGARCVMQRLLDAVSSYLFPQVGQVTISAGVVCIDKMIFSATLLDYADIALYHSKKNGRNRVTFYEDMVESGLTKAQEIKTGEVDLF